MSSFLFLLLKETLDEPELQHCQPTNIISLYQTITHMVGDNEVGLIPFPYT